MAPKRKINIFQEERDENVESQNQTQRRKQISKAKKSKKKPQDELNRIMKSREQNFYIIQGKRYEEEKKWIFYLRGQNYPKIYKTVFSTKLSCTCLDFRYRGKPCKHHFFFITRILMQEGLLDYFKSNYWISSKAFDILDAYLADTLHQKLKQQYFNPENIDLKDDSQCLFCYCQMKKDVQKLQCCQSCKKYFHRDCIAVWKITNPTCPLCRQSLVGDDPFSIVKSIEI